MPRTVDASTVTAAQAREMRIIYIAEFRYDSGYVYLSSDSRNIDYNGNTYLGVGNLGSIDTIEEGAEFKARTVNLALSGVASANVAIALGEQYQGRAVLIHRVYLDLNYNIVGQPDLRFSGFIDNMKINTGGEQSTIEVACRNRFQDWDRPRMRRYNAEDQKSEFAGDLGLDFVPNMVEKEIVWGRTGG